MAIIRTVLGDVPAESAGKTLTHEHLLYTYPGGEFDHRCAFDLDAAVGRIADELRDGMDRYGYRTIVDLTPAEVGRHPELMAKVAERTGANIIGTTGFFPERMGIPYWWRRQTVDEIAEFYVRDITEGMVFAGRQTGIKAGIIKISTGQESVAPAPSPIGPNGRRIGVFEDRLIRAAGRAQRTIGCAVNTHTDPMDYTVTNPGLEQLDVLEEEGADPAKVIIGHAFVNPRMEQLVAICERGANLQIDHIGIPWRHDNPDELDELIATMVCGLAERGYLDQLTITYDRWFYNPRGAATEANPQLLNEKVDLGHLYTGFLPRLVKKGFREADLDRLLVDNPRRILSF